MSFFDWGQGQDTNTGMKSLIWMLYIANLKSQIYGNEAINSLSMAYKCVYVSNPQPPAVS
jgi:hypothetical protein